jgi:Cysteine-rich secretory protein family
MPNRLSAVIIAAAALFVPSLANAACDAGDRPPTPTDVRWFATSDTTIALQWTVRKSDAVDIGILDVTTGKPAPGGVTGGFKGQSIFHEITGLTENHTYQLTLHARTASGTEGCISVPAIVLTTKTAKKVDADACRQYSSRAVQQRKDMQAKGCPVDDGTWTANANAHFSWCVNERLAGRTTDIAAAKGRDDAIQACKKSPAPTPPGADGCTGLTGDFLDICKKHNADRAEHGVPPLTWRADLAANAQAWVGTKPDDPNGCHKDKDKDGNEFFCHQHKPTKEEPWGCGTDANYKFGESLSFGFPSRSGLEAIDGWYCEGALNPIDNKPNYDYDNPKINGGWMNGCDNNPSRVNGHFTQVVWKATKFLGCAKNTCTLGGVSGTLWACEYDPPGNFNADQPGVLSENVPRPIKTLAATHAATRNPVQKTTNIISDVDLYDQPGGRGKKIGILRKGQTLAFMGCHADNWCQVAGGWVWGSFILRNHSR